MHWQPPTLLTHLLRVAVWLCGCVCVSLAGKYLVPLFKNLQKSSRKQLLVGFDPLALFLRDAQAVVGPAALLFADTERVGRGAGASTVGVDLVALRSSCPED